jgi:endoglucanase
MTSKEKKEIFDISKGLLNCPTAPFHEERALQYIKNRLDSYKIPFKEDSGGNIIVHLRKGKKTPPIAFVAHTDHPGIEITKVTPKKVTGRFLGGVDLKMMTGSPVHLFSKNKIVNGTIIKGRLVRGMKNLDLRVSDSAQISPGDFGMFAFPGWRLKNGKIYSRAIDDLIGCSAILNLLIRRSKRSGDINLYGVFTRAEEVGFVGSLHLIEKKLIPGNTMIVSIESSKAYPVAQLGGGPVIRVGDRASLFDPEIGFYFYEVAENLAKRNPQFKFQRLLMAGGTCEATPFFLAGYKTFGIAFPLGNYHNMSEKSKIRPEFINASDYLNGILLMEALVKNPGQFKKRKAGLKQKMKNIYSTWKEHLLATHRTGFD